MKILAVCGFGVGSSMVLKMTIEKVLREKGIEDFTVENTDLMGAATESCDVIFTSHSLYDEVVSKTKVQVYSIEKYLDKEEVKVELEKFLKEYNG